MKELKFQEMIPAAISDDAPLPQIEFPSGEILIIDRQHGELRLLQRDLSVALSISVTEQGLVLNLNALQLNIRALEQLNLSAAKVNIEATEEISLKTGGDFVQTVDKNSHTKVSGDHYHIARVQNIRAELGNVNINANDDVRLNGERVKLNCDE